MPEDYTLVEGLLQAVLEDRHFLASIALKSPVAPAKQLVAPEPMLLKQVLAAAALGATSSNGG